MSHAPAGTVVVRVLLVAAVTVAGVPLNFTVLEAGVGLKYWPWRVAVVPGPPWVGLNPKMARALGEDVEVVMERRLPTAS